MPAPKGNRFWEVRSSHGRKPTFENSDQLWNAALEYFKWVEDNPIMCSELVKFQGTATLAEVPKLRAMTLSGLCIFLDIGTSTFHDYSKKEDFSEVAKQIEEIIYTQKFTGAAADQLNANIIARDLGLADKKEVKHDADDIENLAKITEFLKDNGIDPDTIK